MYTVYMHVTPSGKVYIGVTSKDDVNDRFGSNGKHYRNQIFGRAIKKYGWDNIEHYIMRTDLTEEEAAQEEIRLIELYNATDSNYGYNKTLGGDISDFCGRHPTDDTRKRISEGVKKIWLTDEYRQKQSEREVTEETRQKLVNSHIGHKHTESQKLKISASNKGKHNFTDEQRKQISETVRLQHQKERELGIKRNCGNDSAKETKWYNNGVKNIRSKDGCPEGFVPGRLHYEYTKNRKSRKSL